MAAVLGTAGFLLYVQFKRDLDDEVDSALRSQAADIAALVAAGRGPGAVSTSRERYAQIYSEDGRVVASTTQAAGERLLTAAQVRRAARGRLRFERVRLPDGPARVESRPARHPSERIAAVAVGDSLEHRDQALKGLRTLLLIAAPLALVLASAAGYEVAGAALRPVDRMRAQAERITEGRLSERLPPGEARDEVGALGRTLNAMLDRLERAVGRERRVVSDASHELRTPLTTLRAEAEVALRGERGVGELRESLQSIAAEAKRMTRLADDLLVLARADQGRLPLTPQALETPELLVAAATRASAAAGGAGRTIDAEGAAAGLTVLADPDRTAQALDNIVTNALRYGEGRIALSARREGGLVELHVTDEGRGFPAGVLDHAFERFARGDQARALGEGSGLGLAIVEAVARAHGGRAGARNRAGGGADVWIALPSA